MLLLVDGQSDVFDERVDFLLLAGEVAALEIVEDIQVLSRSQQVEEHIVLRTDTHELSHFVHLFEHIDVIHFCLALAFLN